MSDFKVVVPVQTTNKVLNPSAETTGNFAATSGTTVTRETSTQHYGLYSYRIQSNLDDEGITLDLEALANTDHWVTMRVKGTLPAWEWSLDGSAYTAPALLETIDSEWKLYGLEFPAAEASGQTVLYIQQNGAGVGDYYLDGVQVEEGAWSTYCDGTQPGCEWTGAPHASASTRSPDSRAGGRVLDLEDDYGFNVSGMSGTGTAPQELFVDSYSQLPGGELNSRKVNSRVITLNGFIDGADEADLWAKKEAIQALFDPEAFPEDENGEQPVRLRFVGAAVHKEIAVFYEGGLETTITADDPACAREKVAVRFVADDPYWYEIGESAALLDTEDTATFRTVAGRLRSTGQWDPLGPPGAGGTYSAIRAIVEDATYIYFGGAFLNFDGIANADNIVRYHKQTGVYSAIDVGLNDTVTSMAISPAGHLYVGGLFTNASGVAAADYLAILPSGATSFLAVGTPLTGAASITSVEALVIDSFGNLIIGGTFLNWNNIANADNIVMWDTIINSYSAMGSGFTGTIVSALALGSGVVYAGGTFTLSGGTSVVNIAQWDYSAWSALGPGLDDSVFALAVSEDFVLYAGGNFLQTEGGATTLNYIGAWNNQTWTPMEGGVNGAVNALAVGPDSVLFLSGSFTQAGSLAIAEHMARWNGFTYSHFDIDLPGTSAFTVIYPSRYPDPILPQRYNLYLGFTSSGTAIYAGEITASNGGSAPAFPKVIFNRTAGISAIIQTLRNERTGKELLINWALQDGETLTIDLGSTEKSITSSAGRPAQGAILANSDLGDWSLLIGNNSVTSFVTTSGSSVVAGHLLWKDTFKSQ